jgi:hypothetical protein
MEYPLQDFDIDQETDFLLGNSSSHGNEMDVQTKCNRNPKRRRSLGAMMCRYLRD